MHGLPSYHARNLNGQARSCPQASKIRPFLNQSNELYFLCMRFNYLSTDAKLMEYLMLASHYRNPTENIFKQCVTAIIHV
jgi:hypothetical protein